MTAALTERLREYYTLGAAEREARAIPVEARIAARRALTLAFQKREAAETLWPRGSSAEALRLARASVDAAAAALESFGAGADAQPEWLARARALATDARERTATHAFPELETDARPEDEAAYATLTAAMLAIEEAIGAKLEAPATFERTRRGRLAKTALAIVLPAVSLAWLLHVPDFTQAIASGQRGDDGAALAIDGDPKTHWIAPDRQAGWLDLTMGKARKVRALRVVPYAPPAIDRITKDVHIEAFLEGQLVKALDFTFPLPPAGDKPVWTTVPLDAPKCDRIRIEVKAYLGSAAIAEVAID
jgi:hypothetical protein